MTETAPLPFSLPWQACADFGDADTWYVVCNARTNIGEGFTFWIMATGLTQSVARHLANLHNEWIKTCPTNP